MGGLNDFVSAVPTCDDDPKFSAYFPVGLNQVVLTTGSAAARRFRLCARDRSKAHPCCWAGGRAAGPLIRSTRPGKPTKNDGQIHHAFHGEIHYFDWAIFNSELLNYQRVFSGL